MYERTLVFERMPLTASIQMYSAMTLPFWSRFMYFMSYSESVSVYVVQLKVSGEVVVDVRSPYWR